MAGAHLHAAAGPSDPEQVRAVRLIGRRDDTANGPIPTVLGRIMGVDSIDVNTRGDRHIGWAGLTPPGTALLPIALDCCKITGATCDQSYCDYVATNPPSPCALTRGREPGQDGDAASSSHRAGEQTPAGPSSTRSTPRSIRRASRTSSKTATRSPWGRSRSTWTTAPRPQVIKDIAARFNDTGKYSSQPGGGEDTPGSSPGNDKLAGAPADHRVPEPGRRLRRWQRAENRRRGLLGHSGSHAAARNDASRPNSCVRVTRAGTTASARSASGRVARSPTIDAQYPVLVD